MTNEYRVVQWNAHKKRYDLILISGIVLYLTLFLALGKVLFPPPAEISIEILLIRALGTCAIILLHLILMVGPLARITPKINAILYNRRHLGVTFFIVSALHATIVIAYYGGFGVENPISAVLSGGYRSGSIPFEFLGFLALLIFALMASTSHDFWLANLSPGVWKLMHMGVYIAYTLVIGHVVLGVIASEINIIYLVLVTLGAVTIVSLHLSAGVCEIRRDHRMISVAQDTHWFDVCGVDEIPPDRAKVVQINTDERIAVFKHNDTVSAISNVCAHQNGPLGEGKVIDGCVTCPWHGYQYLPECGQSPPPFTEKIPTYDIRIEGRRVLINPRPNEPGTAVKPAHFDPLPEIPPLEPIDA